MTSEDALQRLDDAFGFDLQLAFGFSLYTDRSYWLGRLDGKLTCYWYLNALSTEEYAELMVSKCFQDSLPVAGQDA